VSTTLAATRAPSAADLGLSVEHTATHWRLTHHGHASLWRIEVDRPTEDSPGPAARAAQVPRLSVRHRGARGSYGQVVDCGPIGAPHRYGSWATEADFVAFCARLLGLVA
jgi:hypothetical protein